MGSHKIILGVNDLQSQNPELANEWHPTKNGDLKPADVGKAGGQRVWWQCSKHPDHEWDAPIYSRASGVGCPICSNKKVLEGFNDLATTEPELTQEWHPILNGDLKPTEISRGYRNKVWWKCGKHHEHEWDAPVYSRVRGAGCAVCSGYRVLQGFNDLITTHPELAKEWHPILNGDLKPTEVTRGFAGGKVWWKCSKHPDHEWKSTVDNRSSGKGCPICSNRQVVKGFNDLTTTHPELAKEWHPILNGEVKPTEVTRGCNDKVWWKCRKHPNHEWDAMVSQRSQGASCPICSGHQILRGFNDLATTHPELLKEWHPILNGDLKPTDVSRGHKGKIWWKCSKHPEHEWDAFVTNRSRGRGCPTCAEHGFNPGKDAWFYLMQRAGEQQIGITNDLKTRLQFHERNGWVLLEHTKEAQGEKVLGIETAFKKWLKKNIGVMEGTTENWATTSMEVQSLAELKAKSGIETDLF